MSVSSLFHAKVNMVSESFPRCPRWSGCGRFIFFFARVRGPDVGFSWLWNLFQLAMAVIRSVIVAMEGILSFFLKTDISAYPNLGRPTTARTALLQAVCNCSFSDWFKGGRNVKQLARRGPWTQPWYKILLSETVRCHPSLRIRNFTNCPEIGRLF